MAGEAHVARRRAGRRPRAPRTGGSAPSRGRRAGRRPAAIDAAEQLGERAVAGVAEPPRHERAGGPSVWPSGSKSSGGAPMLNAEREQVLAAARRRRRRGRRRWRGPGRGARPAAAAAPSWSSTRSCSQAWKATRSAELGAPRRRPPARRGAGARRATSRQPGPWTLGERAEAWPSPRARRPARPATRAEPGRGRRRAARPRGARARRAGAAQHRSRSTTGSARSRRAALAVRGDDRVAGRAGHLVDAEQQRAAPAAARRGVRAGRDRGDGGGRVQRAQPERAAARGRRPTSARARTSARSPMPQLPRRAGGRHLHGHAPGRGGPSGRWQRPGPTSSGRARPAVERRELVEPERQVGRAARSTSPSVGAVLEHAGGAGSSRRRSPAPGRTTPQAGGGRRRRVAHGGPDRRRRVAGRRACQLPVGVEPAVVDAPGVGGHGRLRLRPGPCPRARRRTPAAPSTSTASHVRLKQPGRGHDGVGRSGFGATTTPSPARRLELGQLVGRRGRAGAGAARRPRSRMPDLDRPGQRLVDARRDTAGPAGGARRWADRRCTRRPSSLEDVHEERGVEGLAA